MSYKNANYSAPQKMFRPSGRVERDEYLLRAVEFAKRGADLPQTKLTADAIAEIRQAAIDRDRLRREITDRLSNAALAKKFGVHHRTIEKVISFETHIGVRS